MTDTYRKDLAFIHDAGFGGVAEAAGEYLTRELRSSGLNEGLVVDLGCGSGILAQRLSESGFDVLGIDISEEMIALARKRAPNCKFSVGSFLTQPLPQCIAVTAISECFNYLFDGANGSRTLPRLFKRVFSALRSGGFFVFDLIGPGCVSRGGYRTWTEGRGWAVMVAVNEDSKRAELTREITTFRRVGDSYRRDHEVHKVRLLNRGQVATWLRAAGFRVRTLSGYGEMDFRHGQFGFVARKPKSSHRGA